MKLNGRVPDKGSLSEAFDYVSESKNFNQTELMPVRCCCVPQKLLGWLPVPKNHYVGDRYTYPTGDGDESQPRFYGFDTPKYNPLSGTITISIEAWRDRKTGEGGMAFKSEEIPLEDLIKIPSFIPNSEKAL